MSVSGLGPGQHANLDELDRRLREILEAEAAQDRSRRRKLMGMAIASAGVALIGSALALIGGRTYTAEPHPGHPTANDIAAAQNLSGETAGRPTDNSTMPPAGLPGAPPVPPEVDVQVVEGLTSQASAQTTDPGPARRVSGQPDGVLIASQGSSAAERQSAAGTARPPVEPASEQLNGAGGPTQSSFDLPARRPDKITARVVVRTTEAVIPSEGVGTPSPALPIRTPVKPEREASGANTWRPIPESVAAPSTPVEASKQFPHPLLRAFGDLFGALALFARQAIYPAAVRPTAWSVQLGAPRSEAEAKSDRTRLTAKYASALNGSTISEHKAIVNGETVYRLRVVDLSKADAEALCARVKVGGGDCFIAK